MSSYISSNGKTFLIVPEEQSMNLSKEKIDDKALHTKKYFRDVSFHWPKAWRIPEASRASS